jgi:hypothetical protein
VHFHRESLYRCVLTSSQGEWVAHVRAWDAEEADDLFRRELKAEGLQEHGAIDVRPLSAGLRRAAQWSP